jgi:AcrR family transcriptional regulator
MKRNNDTAVRKADILAAALKVAEASHYAHMTRSAVAAEAGVSGPLVQYYFGTMPQLRRDVMRKAVRDGVLLVIAQGLVAGDNHAKAAPEVHKAAALDLVRG